MGPNGFLLSFRRDDFSVFGNTLARPRVVVAIVAHVFLAPWISRPVSVLSAPERVRHSDFADHTLENTSSGE